MGLSGERDQKLRCSVGEGYRSYTGRDRTEPVNMYQQAKIEDFSMCVERDSAPLVSGEDGLWSQKVVLACYESVKTGHSVKI